MENSSFDKYDDSQFGIDSNAVFRDIIENKHLNITISEKEVNFTNLAKHIEHTLKSRECKK